MAKYPTAADDSDDDDSADDSSDSLESLETEPRLANSNRTRMDERDEAAFVDETANNGDDAVRKKKKNAPEAVGRNVTETPVSAATPEETEAETPIALPTDSLPTSSSQGDSSTAERRQEKLAWKHSWHFALVASGAIIGFGNFFHFPEMVHLHGGSFLILYFTMLLLYGIPTALCELALAQFSSSTVIPMYERAVPLMAGVGWVMIFVIALFSYLRYPVNLAYVMHFFVYSLIGSHPWRHCEGNTMPPLELCRPYGRYVACKSQSGWFFNGSCLTANTSGEVWCESLRWLFGDNFTEAGQQQPLNCSMYAVPDANTIAQIRKRTRYYESAQAYVDTHVVNVDVGANIGDIGPATSYGLESALVTWCLILAFKEFAVFSIPTFSYALLVFRYSVLLFLGVWCMTLEGAGNGLAHMFSLRGGFTTKAWEDACKSLMYSLSLHIGQLEALASFTDFRSNVIRTAVFICLVDFVISIMACLPLFAFMGYLAYEQSISIPEVQQRTMSLGEKHTLVIYVTAIDAMALNDATRHVVLLAIFLMLVTVGLDTSILNLETFTNSVLDQFPALWRRRWYLLCVTLLGFVSTIVCLLQNTGFYFQKFVDKYVFTYLYLPFALLAHVALINVYGLERIMRDIAMMRRQGCRYRRRRKEGRREDTDGDDDDDDDDDDDERGDSADKKSTSSKRIRRRSKKSSASRRESESSIITSTSRRSRMSRHKNHSDRSHKIGKTFRMYLTFCLKYYAPLMLITVIAFSTLTAVDVGFRESWEPAYQAPLGITMVVLVLSAIVAMAAYKVSIVPDADDIMTTRERVHAAAKPTHAWGPFLDRDRTGRYKKLKIGITSKDFQDRMKLSTFSARRVN